MSQDRKKSRTKPTKNRGRFQLQVMVLLYLYFHKNALNEHLINICSTNGKYLKKYVLTDLMDKGWIKIEPLGKKNFFTLSKTGSKAAKEFLNTIEERNATAEMYNLIDIDIDDLKNRT